MEKGVPIRSLSRGIAVLQLINRLGAVSLTDITRQLALPYPTACRIVQTLVHEGLVEQEVLHKRYRATRQVDTLSHDWRDQGRLVEAGRQVLVEATLQHGWPLTLTTRLGQSMRVTDSSCALGALALRHIDRGSTFPMLDCAAGHVHLAFCDEPARLHLTGTLERGPRSEALERLRSGQLVRSVRTAGHALHHRGGSGVHPVRTSSLAVPVFEAGRLVAELSLSFFASAMSLEQAEQRHAAELQGQARRIGQALMQEPRALVDPATGAKPAWPAAVAAAAPARPPVPTLV
ncbi:IclR family transcriptional regulator [Sphaerotilus hippei]|uniref:IclR family transcriptional regulator n=1 Tax=Sphaerotilus hippei TaxID=744406 RepID=A0A318H8Z3_9BURK|nr:helix-turn-helix domain-containing protein [Sphaerotilus hippei]PXW99378.1 IclR family transcriptional regulator [Sphaerotilus hippei]